MRFAASIDIVLPADVVDRSPTLWERCRGALGDEVDLSTDRVRSRVEAATFLYEFRCALGSLGIDNARSLVVDGVLVYEDDKRRPHDLPELMTAFADHLLVQVEQPRDLRLSVEHEEAGLCVEIEANVSLEHLREQPTARVLIVGRVLDLAPQRQESIEAYRRRIEKLVTQAEHWIGLKLQFASFVSRLEHALGNALPGALLTSTTRQLGLDLAAEVPTFPDTPEKSSGRTAAPPRNFTLSLEQRIAAVMNGPPRFALRLRRIEDLKADLLNRLALHERQSLDEVPPAVERGLIELNRLIDEHNRYFPIERDLPIDPSTGSLLVLDQPWKPLAPVSIEGLRQSTAAMRSTKQA